MARKPGGKKLYVTIPKRSDLSSRISTAMILQDITVGELWKTMMVLEPASAVEAARNILPEQIEALECNLQQTERALQLCREPIGDLFYPAFEAVFRRLNAGERLMAAHRNIVEALKNADGGTAELWMRKHIVDFRRGYELANLDLELSVKKLSTAQKSLK